MCTRLKIMIQYTENFKVSGIQTGNCDIDPIQNLACCFIISIHINLEFNLKHSTIHDSTKIQQTQVVKHMQPASLINFCKLNHTTKNKQIKTFVIINIWLINIFNILSCHQ